MRTKLIVFVAGLIITVICSLLFCSTSAGSEAETVVTNNITRGEFPGTLNTNSIFKTQKPCNVSVASIVPVVLADIVEIPITAVPIKVVTMATTTGDCLQYLDIIDNYDWPVEEALRICREESHGDVGAVGDKRTAHVSCGLFQIREIAGRPTCESLKDPILNIKWAHILWLQSGWSPWYNVAKKLNLL